MTARLSRQPLVCVNETQNPAIERFVPKNLPSVCLNVSLLMT
jgi:hypothetical protein